ncbi:MAG TPA: cellulase family glycosylhydrolase, partial [Bacillota bacterium]|nr:cellulase family glycosylhydrolase [Bacillota bacterium]
SGDQTTIKAKLQKVWQQIANTFVDYDEHLIFESMNEVFDGNYASPNLTYYSNLNAYNQIFVDTVRQTGGNNSARWLLVPGWNTNIDYTAGNYGFVIPTDTYRSSTIPSNEKRIMISAHYYSPWDFCGEESGSITQWGATATDTYRKSTWGQEDYMQSQMKMMYDKFVTQGYPVVIGEFGSVDKTSADSTNNKYRAAFAKALCSYCKQYGAVPVYWDNGYNGAYGFGLFNRSNNTITQQGIIDAIMSGMGTTVSPSPTPTQTTTPTATLIVTPTPTVTVVPTTSPVNGNFAVSYTQNDWGSGATVSITIKNTGNAAVNGWKLAFSFAGNQKISNMWCGKYTQSGTNVTVTNESYNGTIAPGGTANFGFNINYSGTNTKPTSFTVNGVSATTY